MDQSTRNTLRNVVTQCRKLLEESVAQVLQGQFGIYATGKKDEVQIEPEARMSHLSEEDRAYRQDLLDHYEHIRALGYKAKDALAQLIREVAFTHLNRFCAYRMMESRGLIRESVSKGLKSQGFLFYLADHEEDERRFNTGQQDVAYRHFLNWLGGTLSEEIGVLFAPTDPANRLYPPQRVIDQVLGLLNDPDLSGIWSEDEAIGWVYQYFTPKELRDQARKESQAPRNSYELAFRNQFFTPRYVVEFLTDNTLGRIWYEMRQGDTRLTDQCRYMVRRPTEVFLKDGEAEPEIAAKATDDLSQKELLKFPVYVPFRAKKDPRELRILDPACGSGHFLLYCFDLLLTIYEEAYGDPDLGPALKKDYPAIEDLRRDVPRLILAHNLHGIDIDPRASQIAALALWLRCQRAYQEMGVKKDRPKITRSNIVCAEPMPGEAVMLKEFVDQLEPKVLGQVVEVVFEKMKLAGEAGSLLKIEEEIQAVVAEARKHWLSGPVSVQRSLFEEATHKPTQQRFDFSGINDDQFFEHAEARVVETLRTYAEKAQSGQRLSRRLFTEDAVRGFAFLDLCHKRFDVVLMNPPFGLASENAFVYLRRAFPRSYTELLATFVDRGATLCDGLLGAITSRAFMVATRLKVWRAELAAPRIRLLADLGEAVMDAAFVEAAAYVLDCREKVSSPTLIALDARSSDDKPHALHALSGLSDHADVYQISVAAFLSLPNTKLLYSLTPSILRLLQSADHFEPLAGTARQGMATWDDFRFIRLRWEVPPTSIGINNTWEHLCKGGPYARYYGDIHLLVKWDKTGDEIRGCNIAANGSDAQARQASDYWRRAGATYSIRSQKGFSARALPMGCLFTGQGPAILSESSLSNAAMLGWLNSELITTLVELQSNDGKFMSGIIKNLPWKELAPTDLSALEAAAGSAVSAMRRVFRSDETNGSFNGLPPAECLSTLTATLNDIALQAKACTAESDTRINEVIYRSYAIDRSEVATLRQQLAFVDTEEAAQEFPEEDAAAAVAASEADVARRVLSFCVGVVFGRWRPLANSAPQHSDLRESAFESLPAMAPAQLEDLERQGLAVDDLTHSEDMLGKIRVALEEIWGSNADVVERQALTAINLKDLRDYFRKPGKGGFWDDHISRYSQSRRKAPIYWLLQSSKKNYAIWLYYHRLDKDILFKALVNYVEPKIRLENDRLESLRAQKGEGGKATKKLDKEIEKQEEFLSELRDFEEKLRRAAELHLVPDLNDGVVLNIAPLHELVPWKEAEKYWGELLEGKYEWSSIGKQLREKGLVK